MSKLLAMMMKPKNYMYATIKGSLTENNGVFSGFSASDYLALQQPFVLNADTVAEINTKIKLTTQHLGAIIGTYNYYGFTLLITGENLIQVGYGQGGGSWVNLITGTTTLSLNTDYFIKVLINKKNITILYSLDNVNWITEISNTLTITTTQNLILDYGMGRTSSAYFRGSIDLNQSYIKINNTKYQLQAVVGYTVVGSPTITDGVVSGFSSSDYLTLSLLNAFDFNKDFEFQVEFTRTSTGNAPLLIGSDAYRGGLYIVSGVVRFAYRENDGTTMFTLDNVNTLATNTLYKTNVKRKGNTLTMQIYKEGVLDETVTTDLTGKIFYIGHVNTMRIGYVSSIGVFVGSIDLNETYIKSNNKLWFNGQPA